MKIAYAGGEIVPTGPKFGTLRNNYLIGDLTPTLERKTPPTSEEILHYSNNLLYVGEFPVRLSSTTTRAMDFKKMRVRQGKAGPNGKPRTAMELLAKGTERYAFGKRERIIKNEGFNKFGEVKVATVDPKAAHKEANGLTWEYRKQLAAAKQLNKLHSVAYAAPDILKAVNGLLRQILLFKGIGFAQIERDIKTAGKPVTYLVNTLIELDPQQTHNSVFVRRFKVHEVVVKKTFRELENIMGTQQETCKVFFSGACCKNLNLWLQELNFNAD